MLNQAKQGRAKSFAGEGTVYWLIVSAILLGYLTVAVAVAAGILYFGFIIALAMVEAVLAYACCVFFAYRAHREPRQLKSQI